MATILKAPKTTLIKFTAVNTAEACSSVVAKLSFSTKIMNEKCPQTEDFLVKSCMCGTDFVNVAYKYDLVPNMVDIALKPYSSLTDAEKKALGDAVDPDKKVYCKNNQVVGADKSGKKIGRASV